jgi:thioredoxin 2
VTETTAGPAAVVGCQFCQTLNRVNLSRLADGPRCGGCERPLLLDRPVKVTDEEFEAVVRGTEIPVLVDFFADWCGPCKMMAPVLDDFARVRAGEVLVLKMNTDQNPVMPQRFGIRGIPTLIAFRDGREAGRQVGFANASVLETLAAARPGQ